MMVRSAPTLGVNIPLQRVSKRPIHSATDQPIWPKPSAMSPPALVQSVRSMIKDKGSWRALPRSNDQIEEGLYSQPPTQCLLNALQNLEFNNASDSASGYLLAATIL